MEMTRCPLCGGKVSNKVCESCGYELPDEEDIVRPYDYIPDRAEDEADEKPQRPEIEIAGQDIKIPPEIKVVKPHDPPAAQRPQNMHVQQLNNGNVQAQPIQPQNPQNTPNGKANNSQNYSGLTIGEKIVKITSDLLKRYGIMMFIAVFMPILALPFGIYAMYSVHKKGRKYDIFAVIWFLIIFGLLYLASKM